MPNTAGLYLLPNSPKTQTKMFRSYNSCEDLSSPLRVYSLQSIDSADSLDNNIDMNPNGSEAATLSSEFCSIFWAKSSLLRQHNFKLKINCNADFCARCQKRIGFAVPSLRCRDCPLRCHIECCRQLTVNCIPMQPVISTKRGHLTDYAPKLAPMVPALIVHCVTEIEARGLQQEGLYRVSSTRDKYKRLKHKFLCGKTMPHLGNKDLHTICCCVKDFLRSLISPLIPIYYRNDFIAATEQKNRHEMESRVHQAVLQLQQAHRDTLAYLVLHWQRVASSPDVKMSVKNIAVVFAPTIFSDADLDLGMILAWQNILTELMLLPRSFWAQFLEVQPASLLDACNGDPSNMGWHSVKTYLRSMVSCPTREDEVQETPVVNGGAAIHTDGSTMNSSVGAEF